MVLVDLEDFSVEIRVERRRNMASYPGTFRREVVGNKRSQKRECWLGKERASSRPARWARPALITKEETSMEAKSTSYPEGKWDSYVSENSGSLATVRLALVVPSGWSRSPAWVPSPPSPESVKWQCHLESCVLLSRLGPEGDGCQVHQAEGISEARPGHSLTIPRECGLPFSPSCCSGCEWHLHGLLRTPEFHEWAKPARIGFKQRWNSQAWDSYTHN